MFEYALTESVTFVSVAGLCKHRFPMEGKAAGSCSLSCCPVEGLIQ